MIGRCLKRWVRWRAVIFMDLSRNYFIIFAISLSMTVLKATKTMSHEWPYSMKPARSLYGFTFAFDTGMSLLVAFLAAFFLAFCFLVSVACELPLPFVCVCQPFWCGVSLWMPFEPFWCGSVRFCCFFLFFSVKSQMKIKSRL